MRHLRALAWRPGWLLIAAVPVVAAQQVGWSRVGHAVANISGLVEWAVWLAVKVAWPFVLAGAISLLVGCVRRYGIAGVWWRLVWRRRWVPIVAPVLGVVGLLVVVLVAAPPWFVHDRSLEGLKAQNGVRTTLLQGLGGMAVLVGAYFTYRQLQTNRESQITERFTRAIDQLGHSQPDVRIGGIYALERIARDSPDDRITISEVLTAYIRSHSPWPPTLPGQYVATAPIDDVPELQVRAPDVQASLTVLGRGGFARLLRESTNYLDLHGVDLRRTILVEADLLGAALYDANLSGAALFGVNLAQSSMSRANLTGADLIATDFTSADLHRASLARANLDGSRLTGANLDGADLAGADGNFLTEWPHGFDWHAAGATISDI